MGDLQSAGAGAVEVGDDFVGAVPGVWTGKLQVRDLGGNLRLAGDGGEFVEGVDDVGALVAHVARVDAAVGRGDLGEGHDLIGLGERARQVNQARAQADGAVLHRLVDQASHALEFGSGWRAGETAAHDLTADRVVADEGGDIEADPGLGDAAEKVCDVELRTAAVAGDDGRHAHAQEVFTGRQRGDILRVGVHIDEAGCDHLAAGVDLGPAASRDPADRGDPAVPNRDVGVDRSGTGAIDHAAAADHDIVFGNLGRRTRRGAAGQENKGKQRGGSQTPHGAGGGDHGTLRLATAPQPPGTQGPAHGEQDPHGRLRDRHDLKPDVVDAHIPVVPPLDPNRPCHQVGRER